jgi:nucleotide-binding universal stress UspA family protein
MSLRTILVHLDDSGRCGARVEFAARLARAHGGHLVGLLPTGLYDGTIPADALPTGASDFIAESADYLARRAERIADLFREQAEGPGPLSLEVRKVDGMSADAVVHHGRASDLVVLGQDGGDARDVRIPDMVPQVLMNVGRPVLVLPFAGRFTQEPARIVAAWDGSREAAVALRDALPLLARATQLTLLNFSRNEETDAPDRLRLDEMRHWLLRHGIASTAQQQVTEIGFADALLSRASDLGAELIVMGGYGHARLRELMLGGVTREILSHMTVPVLMAH